ncbi:MAG: phage Gp37/Gp68 family protein [Fusobacteriaceae bacterium]|jgi:protein gp37|nr:phage Gp37/Gp68 family protein [Fusobacteriaceae bacterium]
MSKIEWTQRTWNPITGCTPCSIGCQNCYAKRMSHRLNGMRMEKYKEDFKIKIHEKELTKGKFQNKGKMIFVGSMSDIFHPEIPIEIIEKIFSIMEFQSNNIYQVLTKRPERFKEIKYWPPNVWAGVTIEHRDYIFRAELLKETKAKIKFISAEPLLSGLELLDIKSLDWVIAGGETGPGARLNKVGWFDNLKAKVHAEKKPFFFKGYGGFPKKAILPDDTCQEFPNGVLLTKNYIKKI